MPAPRSERRRRLLGLLPFGAAAGVGALAGAGCAQPAAPASASAGAELDFDVLWRRHLAQCVQDDGRVVDHDTDTRASTSEGQAYTLFLALVADDRPRFDAVLDWTRRHLAGGDFAARLPAWHWGRRDGRWEVIDPNPATDADLWLAHTLIEAARLWGDAAHAEQARALLRRIQRDEVADVPGLGPMLMPGPSGFVSDDRRTWRFNPSYTALHQLQALAGFDPGGPWAVLARQGMAMMQAVCPQRLAPDWVAWQLDRTSPASGGQWVADPQHGDTGSYDAIRCYLWAGVLSPQDPRQATLLRVLGGIGPRLRPGAPVPERLRTRAGDAGRGDGPPAFDAALLPLLSAQGERAALQDRLARLRAAQAGPLRYYDLVLMLFATGWLQGRWRCDRDGRLLRSLPPKPRRSTSWNRNPSPCPILQTA